MVRRTPFPIFSITPSLVNYPECTDDWNELRPETSIDGEDGSRFISSSSMSLEVSPIVPPADTKEFPPIEVSFFFGFIVRPLPYPDYLRSNPRLAFFLPNFLALNIDD